jgi:hypothetical protein
MVGFVIPFKPFIKTRDWIKENSLLQRTIISLLNQKNEKFRIFVIYTDLPSVEIVDRRVILIKSPFEFLAYSEIPNCSTLVKKFPNEQWLEGLWDKSRKVCYGCLLAKELGCNYIMAVDSDDLVSNKLVGFVESNNMNGEVAGWYVNKGYVYEDGAFYLMRSYKMNFINASTHIIRSDLVRTPDFNSTGWEDYSLFTDHGYLKDRIKHNYNEHLKPLPFFAVIYIAHANNMSDVSKNLAEIGFKNILKKAIYGTLVNKKIQREFSMSSI